MLTPLQVVTDMNTKQLECVSSLDWLAVKHYRWYRDLQCSANDHLSGLLDCQVLLHSSRTPVHEPAGRGSVSTNNCEQQLDALCAATVDDRTVADGLWYSVDVSV